MLILKDLEIDKATNLEARDLFLNLQAEKGLDLILQDPELLCNYNLDLYPQTYAKKLRNLLLRLNYNNLDKRGLTKNYEILFSELKSQGFDVYKWYSDIMNSKMYFNRYFKEVLLSDTVDYSKYLFERVKDDICTDLDFYNTLFKSSKQGVHTYRERYDSRELVIDHDKNCYISINRG